MSYGRFLIGGTSIGALLRNEKSSVSNVPDRTRAKSGLLLELMNRLFGEVSSFLYLLSL